MADGGIAPKKRRVMPAQNPATSEQSVGTPWEFVDAVEARFGKLEWDLAASAENCVVRNMDGDRSSKFFSVKENSLAQDWTNLGSPLWLNPPFDHIADFAKKCVADADPRALVLLLTPGSIDANWWWEFCRPHAITYALSPRLTFVGHNQPYPKGLALHVFGTGATGFGRWRWKKDAAK